MRNELGVFSVLVLLVACGAVDPYGDGPRIAPDPAKPKSTSCGSIEGKDPSTLPQCKGTKAVDGRCVPRSELGSFAETFEQATCKDDEGCVPDEVVKQGSKIELKKCTAVLESEGRCFWPLAKDIVESYDILKGATKDQCAPDQVCAPCIHPLTKQDTGVCSTGASGNCEGGTSAPKPTATCPQIDPVLDVSTFRAEDCGSNMLCVDAGLAGELAKSLKKCKSGVCAPKKAVERGGNYVPKTCRSTANAEGRCTNVGVPQVAEQKSILPKADCDADELCAPCFDPRDGSETGACRTASCDAPKEPAKTFAKCCGGRARCVPTSAVDPSAQSMLAADTCTGDTPLCAPNELIPLPGITPKKCKAAFGLAVAGICVSKCAIDVFGAGLVQGDCADDEMCAPCRMLPASSCTSP